ncbi:sigma-54-dependent transcriptional regulator [Sphingobacterium griseoflavum]|uniref:Sigma-54-dependent Fis family transcriptional regulator n=1 Tax=Sphingobacterium griseoflavum TaxID=1474952 RepID=A0ABQ3HUH1_9SPHI|nr:sigma-54 dependent transcriptional regulator [Sphingobacterium griseoflavum]GHE35670.1 sigma-54-dependent Fis family transcriptional regulator [Sphingobacterium griseoflavum]
MSKILIVDDEDKLRTLVSRIIAVEADGYEVFQAGSLAEARNKIAQVDVDVILCDVKLPDGNGVDFIVEIKKSLPLAEVILFTAHGNIPDSVSAIKHGAFDYLTKGDDNNKILPLIGRAAEKVKLAKRVAHLENRAFRKYSFDNVLGSSPAIKKAIELAGKVAPLDTSVLLLGETGTGKEVFANALHFASKRSDAQFVAINCSAFSKELLESELFGYRAGSFTGAQGDKKGLIEEAHKGTLFLDEIGEMGGDLQAKLLRLLESGEYLKIGETKPRRVDIRIVAATNRNLEQEIQKGSFRMDLFYRLSTFQLVLPPLRNRVEDIDELVRSFASGFAAKIGKKSPAISDEFLNSLKMYQWKGNIRELKNVIERSLILADDDLLDTRDLPMEILEEAGQIDETSTMFALSTVEKKHIKKVLGLVSGNKTEAARLLQIGLSTLYRKIEEYGLNKL